MTRPAPPTPPAGLSDDAVALWAGFYEDLADDGLQPDAREVAVLAEACRHLTLASRLEARLADLDDVVVPGSRGNLRVTPLVGEIDKVRRTVSTLLRSIRHVDLSATNGDNVTRGRHRRG